MVEVASVPYLTMEKGVFSMRGWTDRATKSVKRWAIQLHRKACGGGGGSVLSGRRCFVTFVSSQPACRWRDNQSPPSLGKRKTKRRKDREREKSEGRVRGPRVREKIESKAPRFPRRCICELPIYAARLEDLNNEIGDLSCSSEESSELYRGFKI